MLETDKGNGEDERKEIKRLVELKLEESKKNRRKRKRHEEDGRRRRRKRRRRKRRREKGDKPLLKNRKERE